MGSLVLPLKAIDWLIFHLSVAEQEDCSENQGFLGVWHLLIINNLRLHLHEWCGMRWNTFLVINTISQANISVWEEFNTTILSIIHSILLATQCYSKIMGFCSRRWWRSVWHITSLQSISLLFVEKCELLWIWLVNSSVVKLSISIIHVFSDHVQLLLCEVHDCIMHFVIHWTLRPKYVCRRGNYVLLTNNFL